MPQQGSDSKSDEDVATRSNGSQFRNAMERTRSLLLRTGGVLPGSVPRVGEMPFIKSRITKFGEPIDDNQSLNRAQLEELKRQLAEKESIQATLASRGVGITPAAATSSPPRRTEAQAYLLGIIEVRTPLRNLPVDQKRELALMSLTAVVNGTPNISKDGLELGPVITSKKDVSVVMDGQTVTIMVENATGGGVHEMARHVLKQVAMMVHTGDDKVLVYIGRDAMGRRTAVALKLLGVLEYTQVVANFMMNRKSEE